MAKKAAYRYAKAIYSLAQEQKTLDDTFDDMEMLRDTFASSSSLRNVLKNPVIHLSKKAEIAVEIFKSANELTIKLLHLLAQKNRIHQLDQVADAFVELYETAHNIQRATVFSANKLDEATIKDIRKKIKELTGSEAELKQEIDASLIGGLLLKINDKQFDASVSGKFKKLRQELTTQN
jgi:F-type H+-transporting ATPase subunit delta